MQNATKIGLNYTGTQMSPKDCERQVRASMEVQPDFTGDERNIAILRGTTIAEADAIGSVPIPGSAKGMVITGLSKLAGQSPEVLIDKLGERLAFERGGTRLYEALIAKVESIPDTSPEMLGRLKHFHDEETAHFKLVAGALEKLGADPTAMTPGADVSGVTAMGVLQVISDPRTNLAQSLNALLTAELADNAGWELLIDLANAGGACQSGRVLRSSPGRGAGASGNRTRLAEKRTHESAIILKREVG